MSPVVAYSPSPGKPRGQAVPELSSIDTDAMSKTKANDALNDDSTGREDDGVASSAIDELPRPAPSSDDGNRSETSSKHEEGQESTPEPKFDVFQSVMARDQDGVVYEGKIVDAEVASICPHFLADPVTFLLNIHSYHQTPLVRPKSSSELANGLNGTGAGRSF